MIADMSESIKLFVGNSRNRLGLLMICNVSEKLL